MHDRSGNAATSPPAAGAVPRGRYAPSPTGPLHLGNIRTALLAWLQIRWAGGSFILRIDDIDAARIRPGGMEQLIDDLRWRGLDWDEGPDVGGPHAPYLQSQRSTIYYAAFRQLRDHGRVFACHCSRKDIALAASAPHARAAHTLYTGTSRAPRRVPTGFARRTWLASSRMGLASSHTSRRSAPANCSVR